MECGVPRRASRWPSTRCTSRCRRSSTTCGRRASGSSVWRPDTRPSRTCSCPSRGEACVTEGRSHSALLELTLARFRLFFREPSALFWTFGFPVILSVALGIAFRNRPPAPVLVDIEDGPGASAMRDALASPGVKALVRAPAVAKGDLRTGKVPLVVVPGDPVAYVFDETRPEARLARAAVDDRLQRTAGRTDPV